MERERERAAELMAELEDQFEENMTNASRRSSGEILQFTSYRVYIIQQPQTLIAQWICICICKSYIISTRLPNLCNSDSVLKEFKNISVYSHRSFGNLSPRHRSMTVDSLASLAESRFGQIDIHDDNDEYTVSLSNFINISGF